MRGSYGSAVVAIGATVASVPAAAADRDDVLAVQAAIDAALAANDPVALAPLLTVDATRTGPAGVLSSRTQWLEQMRSGAIRYRSVRRTAPDVRLYGDVAVVTGEVLIDVEKPGLGVIEERNRYLRVYVRQGGRWRLAAHQATAIAG